MGKNHAVIDAERKSSASRKSVLRRRYVTRCANQEKNHVAIDVNRKRSANRKNAKRIMYVAEYANH